MVLGRDSKPWARTQLVPNTLSLQWGVTQGAGVATQGSTPPAGIKFYLPTQSPFGFSGNGHPLDDVSLMIARPGVEFHIINAFSSPWCFAYVPYETLAGASENATTRNPLLHGIVKVPVRKIERFRSFIVQFAEAAQRGPRDFESAARERQLEDVGSAFYVLASPTGFEPVLPP